MEYERIKHLIDKGIGFDQIRYLLDISRDRLKAQIELLNDPTSPNYNPEEYIRINAKIKENALVNNKKKMRIHSNIFELNANLTHCAS